MIEWRVWERLFGPSTKEGAAMQVHRRDTDREQEKHAMYYDQYRLAERIVAEIGAEVDLERFRSPLRGDTNGRRHDHDHPA